MIRFIICLFLFAGALFGCQSADEAPALNKSPSNDSNAPSEVPPERVDQAPNLQDPERRRRLVDAGIPVDGWQPNHVTTGSADINATLDKAAAALHDGRIATGDENALSLYMSILEVQPENAKALTGIAEIERQLLAKGRVALEGGQLNIAAQLCKVLVHIRPESADVQALASQVRRGQEVRVLLVEAARLALDGQWVSDSGDSAVFAYREVLKLEPENLTARAALLAIEDRFLSLAIGTAEAGDYRKADQHLADAASVGAGSGAVLNVGTRIVVLRQKRAADIIRQANSRIVERDLAGAAALLETLETVSAQSEGIEDLRSRIENARIYGGFRPGQVLRDLMRSGASSPSMVVIPIGSFRMGSNDTEADRRPNEGPTRTVSFERGFAVAVTETTVAEFRAFVNATGYRPVSVSERKSTVYDEKSGSMIERRGVSWENDYTGGRAAENLPVIHVAWDDATAYAKWLSEETGKTYRLPSEAEFEYVLRAGSNDMFSWGDSAPAMYVGNLTGDGDRSASKRNWVNSFENYSDGYWGPAPVGQFDASAFGTHDFVGNVSEWVEDCWHDSYQRAPKNGASWVNPGCSRRVIRGASWASAPDQVRSAFRLGADPETTNARLGFRVARELE